MDLRTKATLWLAAVVMVSYFAWLYADCAPDPGCRVVFCGPRGAPYGITHAPAN
jgi:hypothetical protein